MSHFEPREEKEQPGLNQERKSEMQKQGESFGQNYLNYTDLKIRRWIQGLKPIQGHWRRLVLEQHGPPRL